MDKVIDLKLVVSLLVPALITVTGWFIVNLITARRERKNKKREKVIDYLIVSYKILTDVPHREEDQKQLYYARLEEAIANIQLLGSVEQVALAKKVAVTFAKEKEVDLSGLIVLLRDNLRQELNLEEVKDKIITHIRINFTRK